MWAKQFRLYRSAEFQEVPFRFVLLVTKMNFFFLRGRSCRNCQPSDTPSKFLNFQQLAAQQDILRFLCSSTCLMIYPDVMRNQFKGKQGFLPLFPEMTHCNFNASEFNQVAPTKTVWWIVASFGSWSDWRKAAVKSHSLHLLLSTGKRFEVVNIIILILFQYVHEEAFCLHFISLYQNLDAFILLMWVCLDIFSTFLSRLDCRSIFLSHS